MKKLFALMLTLVMLCVLTAVAEENAEVVTDITVTETTVESDIVAEEEAAAEPEAVPAEEEEAPAGRLAGIIIGIDPGHQHHADSAKEPVAPHSKEKKAKVSSGTSGRKTKVPEYVTNLEISLKLRDALVAEGATVVMTRETHDVRISNKERAELMNKAGCDLVLRIHCNGNNKESVHGTNLYIRGKCAYNKKEVADPAALLHAEEEAANKLIVAMCARTGAKNSGVHKRDSYTMNNWSTVPIILVECGYMTNHAEDEKLNDPAYQDKLCAGMVDGILDYFGV